MSATAAAEKVASESHEVEVASKLVATPKPSNFDISTATVTSSSLSISPSKVTEALWREVKPKGSYESKDEYKRRLDDAKAKVLFGNVRLAGMFAFPATENVVSLEYDADRQEFSWKLRSEADFGFKDWNLIEIERASVSSGEYESYDDLFRTKYFKTITHTKNVYLKIAGMRGFGYIKGKVKVPRNEAQSVHRRVKVLLIGKLRPPYVEWDTKFPHNQNETNMEHRSVLDFSLSEIWLFDSGTGHILSKSYAFGKG
jgi:hypothetical protein